MNVEEIQEEFLQFTGIPSPFVNIEHTDSGLDLVVSIGCGCSWSSGRPGR
jgi:hypothetical protein